MARTVRAPPPPVEPATERPPSASPSPWRTSWIPISSRAANCQRQRRLSGIRASGATIGMRTCTITWTTSTARICLVSVWLECSSKSKHHCSVCVRSYWNLVHSLPPKHLHIYISHTCMCASVCVCSLCCAVGQRKRQNIFHLPPLVIPNSQLYSTVLCAIVWVGGLYLNCRL